MSMLTIKNIDKSLKSKLQSMTAGTDYHWNSKSIVSFVRQYFRRRTKNLGSRIHRRFAKLGGVELKLPKRSPSRDVVKF